MPKTKKFIDRKSAVTFNLVHRSQRDPLVADHAAPQRVLVPVAAPAPAPTPTPADKQPLSKEQRRIQQQKYGIYFDDDYNYLQHLRDTQEVTMLLQPKASHKRTPNTGDKALEQKGAGEHLQLPSSVFASEVEEDVGLLNKAAPQGLRLDLDPDVVAALDEDFNFDDPDNQLEDNFMEMAMAEGSEEEYSEDDESDGGSDKSFASDQEYDSDDSQGSGDGRMPAWDKFGAEETKSRFSQYSMSSSVIRRSQGLDLLDHRFEKMFAEYDDTELGALDCEEIEGALPGADGALLRAADHFQAQRASHQLDKADPCAWMTGERMQRIAEESPEEEMTTVAVPEKERWDCESILSTYSTLYNHPKLIQEPKKPQKIKISPKTGIPLDTINNDSNRLTIKSLAKFNAQQTDGRAADDDAHTLAESVLSTLSVLSLRPRDEAPEEKRERKRLLKEYRKERRVEKKANKEAFKEEKKRQEKIMMNNRNNIQGQTIL